MNRSATVRREPIRFARAVVARPLLSTFAACLCACIVACGIVSALGVSRDPLRLPNPVDLRAFRCGALVAARGGDPYANEPLHACERGAERDASVSSYAKLVVMPVPLPPYALWLYRPLGWVSSETAAAYFPIASFCAAIWLVGALRRLAPLPLPIVATVTIAGVWLPSVSLGQPAVFVCAALVAAALAVRSGAFLSALPALLVAAVAPHFCAPALAALATEKRARGLLLAFVAAIAALSAIAGAASSAEYVVREIPAHAHAELSWLRGQATLAAALVAIGVAPASALAVNDVAWIVAATSAILVARRLASATGDRAHLVVVPVAIALPWSPFLHATWFGLALPAALLLLHGNPRSLPAGTAVALLSIWWSRIMEAFPALDVPSTLRYRSDLRASANASEVWGGFVHALALAEHVPAWVLALMKVPSWLGFVALTYAAVRPVVMRRVAAPHFENVRADAVRP